MPKRSAISLYQDGEMARADTATLSPESFDQSRATFRGELVQNTDPGYDMARKLYNGMIDKRPPLVAKCVDLADVIASVKVGVENDLLTAIFQRIRTKVPGKQPKLAWGTLVSVAPRYRIAS